MALDGIFLHCLQREIADGAVGDRVDKIHQPTKEEIVLTLRGRSGAKKLLLSCRPDSARVHFTDYAPENPARPPMFTMLLRKLLQGGAAGRCDPARFGAGAGTALFRHQ